MKQNDAKACSDCNSTNAICETLSGYVKCSCKDGFVGDGLNCTRLVFCDSATCCPQGYTWDIQTKTCKDINECASTSPLVNKCVPTTNCVNLIGIFSCTNAASPLCSCTSSTDCMNIQGNVQCADPCIHYEELDGSSRLYTIDSNGRFSTDRYYFGWFRYKNNLQMKQGCVGPLKCGSRQPLSLWADPPAVGEGIKKIPLLVNSLSGCTKGANISVKACPGEYYVYKYTGLLSYDVYCTENPPTTTTTTTTTTPATTTTTTTISPTTATELITPNTTTTTDIRPINTTAATTDIPPINTTAATTDVPRTSTKSATSDIPLINTTAATTDIPPTNTTAATTDIPPINTTAATTDIPPTNTTAATTDIPPINTTAATTDIPPTNTTAATTDTTDIPPINTTAATTDIPPINTTSATTDIPPTNTTAATTDIPPLNTTAATTDIPPINTTAATTDIPNTSTTAATTDMPTINITASTTDISHGNSSATNTSTTTDHPATTNSLCSNTSVTPVVIPTSTVESVDNITVTHVQSRTKQTVRLLAQTVNGKKVHTFEVNTTIAVSIEMKTITPSKIFIKTSESVTPQYLLVYVTGENSDSGTEQPGSVVNTSETTMPNTEPFQPDSYCSQPAQANTITESSSVAGNTCSEVTSATAVTTITTTEEVIVAGPNGFSSKCTKY
ncbi:uncharacterized protein LOC134607799 [Pelobates fuscus]|uniref:uncharacterized protein LOC134607799 n=1 Tax=Pelobates fuscus TaxID=191477 RepID=UPI002FE4B1DC